MDVSTEEPPPGEVPPPPPPLPTFPAGGVPRDFNDLKARAQKRRGSPWYLRLFAGVLLVTVIIPVLWVFLYGILIAPGTLLMAQRAGEGEHISHVTKPLAEISPYLVRAVIAAEDARFCSHNGFDVEAIQKAVKYNQRAERRGSDKRRGASTISQQTAKNLFLWPQRSWVRKGLEVYFTFLIETVWPKKRIMEQYLNAAEWGDGAFGAEAAARLRFNKSAADLTPAEASRLAAVLPSPNKWSATSPGRYVRGRAGAILARAGVVRSQGLAACVLGKERVPSRPSRTPPELPPLPPPPPDLAPPVEGAPLDALVPAPDAVAPAAEPAPDATAGTAPETSSDSASGAAPDAPPPDLKPTQPPDTPPQ